MKIEKVMSLTQNNDLNNYFPVFKRNGVIIDKKKDCYWLIPHRENPVSINESTYEILGLCDGSKSMKDIVTYMAETYEVDEEQIKQDLISVLYSLYYVNLVVWKKGINYFQEVFQHQTPEFLYKRLELLDIRNCVANTKDEALISAKYDKENMYTNINLQVRMSLGKDVYFGCYRGDKLEAVVALEPVISIRPCLEFLSYNVEYLYINEESQLTDVQFDDFVKWCVGWYLESNNIDAGQTNEFINFQALEDDSSVEQLKKLGFKAAGVMENENKTQNVTVFEKELCY